MEIKTAKNNIRDRKKICFIYFFFSLNLIKIKNEIPKKCTNKLCLKSCAKKKLEIKDINDVLPYADGVAIASVLHYNNLNVSDIKKGIG